MYSLHIKKLFCHFLIEKKNEKTKERIFKRLLDIFILWRYFLKKIKLLLISQ